VCVCRSDGESIGTEHENLPGTVTVGRRPRTRHDQIPGTTALLSGPRAETGQARREKRTGRYSGFVRAMSQ